MNLNEYKLKNTFVFPDKAIAQNRINDKNERLLLYLTPDKSGYIAYTEVGENTNNWKVIVNIPNKELYAISQERAIEELPDKHLVTCGDTITVDGLRNWNKQTELKYSFAPTFTTTTLCAESRKNLFEGLYVKENNSYKYSVFNDEDAMNKAIEILREQGFANQIIINKEQKTIKLIVNDLIKN